MARLAGVADVRTRRSRRSPDARPVRHPPRARPRPGPCCARSATRSSASAARSSPGTNGKGSVLALAGGALRDGRPARRRDAQAAPRHATASGSSGRRPPDRRRRLRAARRARCSPPPTASRAGYGAADRVRAADRGRLPPLRRGRASTSRSSRSASAAGSTRPTPGTAASRRHQRRPRPHGPARADDRGHRPREGGDHRAGRPRGDRRDRRRRWRHPPTRARGSACR